VPAPGSADLDSDGIIGDFAGEMAALPALNWGAGHSASSIATGSVNCAVLNDATLKCWGQGYEGQLGQPGGNLGSTPEELAALNGVDLGKGRTAKTVVVQHSHVCAVLDNGQLKCWGFNGSGQLGLGTTVSVGDAPGDMGDNLHPVNLGGHTVHQVAAGLTHTCAILDDGTLKCWGSNDSGQLGLGDIVARGTTGGAQVVNPSVDLSF
jgi:alpha-tubulin suppressor-like RCC1 family protein